MVSPHRDLSEAIALLCAEHAQLTAELDREHTDPTTPAAVALLNRRMAMHDAVNVLERHQNRRGG